MIQARHLAATIAVTGLLAGCGAVATQQIPASSRVIHIPGTSLTRIVLSAPGVQRIGLQTVRVRSAGSSRRGSAGGPIAIPYSAVIYAPSGRTYAFRALSPLTFTEQPITVDHIVGNTAYLSSGLAAGAHVVSIGAEELYGVQAGVLAQT